MTKIATGTVTFLFTDIEGSTELAFRNPEKMQAILNRHNEILKDSIEGCGGHVFKTVGDSFCSSFEKPSQAVNAAIEIQKRISTEDWQEGKIKVRIGIHSGEAEWNGDDYSGYLSMSRTQRIMSTAHGGQILISKTSYNVLLNENYYSSVNNFRDLGERRLKDLIQPIVLYQVNSAGLESEFPPLSTLDARPNNLPVQLTTYIGMENEIQKVKQLLGETHLLTIMGSGGSGKTRLCLQAGAEIIDNFINGVWVIELGQLSEPSYILPEIASALNIGLDPKRKIIDVIIDFMREKEILLILDNCEHLIDECAGIINTLLRVSPKLKILVSSREALRITGESTYKIPTFALPDPKKIYTPESIKEFDVVRLFNDRALSIKHDFKISETNANAIAKLCTQLDGIPLAVELAAARVKVLSVEEIFEKLRNRFSLLTGGNRTAMPRQQTLRAMIDWSYGLLSIKEKLLYERLSVFLGGWSLEEAEEICHDEEIESYEILDLMTNLVDKSLIVVKEFGNDNRFDMLVTIRQYGIEKFGARSESAVIQKRHFEVFSRLTENCDAKLSSADQKEWITKYETELDNLREGLKWATANEPGAALKMALDLCSFWNQRFYFAEGLEFLNSILEKEFEFDKELLARGLYWKGNFLMETGSIEDAKIVLQKSYVLFEEIKNEKGMADADETLGVIAFQEADYEIAKQLLSKSLNTYKELKLKKSIAHALYCMGGIEYMQLDYESSKNAIEESLRLYSEVNDKKHIGILNGNLGTIEFQQGNLTKALEFYEEYLSASREQDNKKGISLALLNISYAYNEQGEFLKSKEIQEESLLIGKEIGNKNLIALSLLSLGFTEQKLSNHIKARELYLQSIKIFDQLKDKYQVIEGIINLSSVYISLKEFGQCVFLLSSFDKLYRIIDTKINKINSEEFKKNYEISKTELSESEFTKYWDEGQKVTFGNILGNILTDTFKYV